MRKSGGLHLSGSGVGLRAKRLGAGTRSPTALRTLDQADVNVAGDITDQMEIFGRLGGTLTSHRRAGELSLGVKYKF